MKHFALVVLLSIANLGFGQDVYLSGGMIGTSPLAEFCDNNYANGLGAQFGLSLQQKVYKNWSIAVGLNGILSGNGLEKTKLPLGDYTLSNRFTTGQFLVNGVYAKGIYSWYGGLHIGRANFFTSEYLSFAETQEDGSTYYSDQLYKSRVFEYGGQIGTLIQLSPAWQLNIGASLIKSDERAKYIDFPSFKFDGEEINYKEPVVKPFLFTFNVGFRLSLSKLESFLNASSGSYSSSYSDANYNVSVVNNYHCVRETTSSSSSRSRTTSSSKKGSAKPKLHKRGKTPVKYD